MGERRLLPYIHRQTPPTPSVYYDDDLAYWHSKRRRYLDGYYRPNYYYPQTHRSLYQPRRYYDDYWSRRSLPVVYPSDDYPSRAVSYDYDVCHCRTLPRISSKLVPSMHYDEVRCPHCASNVRREEEKVMAYPWTPPPEDPYDETMILRRMEEEPLPHSTVSAPAKLTGNRRKVRAGPAPQTAPPFLFLKGREKQNLLSDEELRGHRRGKHRPTMEAVPEDNELANQISPYDSVSNVGIMPYRPLYHDRQRPRHSAYSEEYFHTSPRRVEDSPKPIRLNHPRRQFDGHYVDIRNGKKYKYKVNYMDNGQVDSERRQLRSL